MTTQADREGPIEALPIPEGSPVTGERPAAPLRVQWPNRPQMQMRPVDLGWLAQVEQVEQVKEANGESVDRAQGRAAVVRAAAQPAAHLPAAGSPRSPRPCWGPGGAHEAMNRRYKRPRGLKADRRVELPAAGRFAPQ